jgi:hypothetical protein
MFLSWKVIIILVVVAYKRYCNCKIMVRICDINEGWLIFHDSVIVIFIVVNNIYGAITLTYVQ